MLVQLQPLCVCAAPSPPPGAAGDLLQQRASIAANVRRLVAGFREAEATDKAASAMPSYGSTVTVMSESQVGGWVVAAGGGLQQPACGAAAFLHCLRFFGVLRTGHMPLTQTGHDTCLVCSGQDTAAFRMPLYMPLVP